METDQIAGQCDTTIRSYRFDHNRPFTPSFAPDSVQYVVTVTTSGSAGLSDGDHTLFFWLARQSNGAWLVTSEGTGP
jgi:hypothetical protein